MASRRATKFWNRLTQWYGARLADSYGASIPDEWAAVVDAHKDSDIDDAMRKVKAEHIKFPPTLGEFEAAIPKRNSPAARSMASLLSEFVVARREMCPHQRLGPWHYFGPEIEFPRGSETVKHADVEGVVVYGCDVCGRKSFRVKAVDEEFQSYWRQENLKVLHG